MSKVPTEEFTLTWPWAILFIAVQLPFAVIALMVWLGGSITVALGFLAIAVLYAWPPLWGTHVSVGVEGMNIYRSLHKLSWSDVVEASPRSMLGFRYLRLKRARGIAVWLPLYLVSHRKLDEALRDWAPEGNPIKQCI